MQTSGLTKFYLAGPLFAAGERSFNKQLAIALEKSNFEVFLPQETETNNRRISDNGKSFEENIFLNDVNGIDISDAVLACMDGPDPDSGTCWECGYAYAKGKEVFTYRTDFRGAGDAGESKFNLMMWCGSFFIKTESALVSTQDQIIEQIVNELKNIFEVSND